MSPWYMLPGPSIPTFCLKITAYYINTKSLDVLPKCNYDISMIFEWDDTNVY